jgi:putative tricarboxylic transport membrane protein
MNIRISVDILTGILFLGISLIAIAIISTNYSVGTAARMGPGFFPLVVSAILGGLGAVLILRSFFIETDVVGVINLRPLLLVLASTLFFGIAIEDLGIAIVGLVLVFGARLAGDDFKFLEVAILAAALVGGSIFLFSYALGLNLPQTKFW